jgi:hypothetical protein
MTHLVGSFLDRLVREEQVAPPVGYTPRAHVLSASPDAQLRTHLAETLA